MTNCRPRRSESHGPIRRAARSLRPAGPKPTITRTGRDGYGCAVALSATAEAPVKATDARKILRVCIAPFPLVCDHFGDRNANRILIKPYAQFRYNHITEHLWSERLIGRIG